MNSAGYSLVEKWLVYTWMREALLCAPAAAAAAADRREGLAASRRPSKRGRTRASGRSTVIDLSESPSD